MLFKQGIKNKATNNVLTCPHLAMGPACGSGTCLLLSHAKK